jgi:hypothetical protein
VGAVLANLVNGQTVQHVILAMSLVQPVLDLQIHNVVHAILGMLRILTLIPSAFPVTILVMAVQHQTMLFPAQDVLYH